MNNALFAGHVGLLAEAVRLGERLGIRSRICWRRCPRQCHQPGAGPRGRTGFRLLVHEATGGFVDKDVAVVRGVAAELGGDLGVLDQFLRATDASGRA